MSLAIATYNVLADGYLEASRYPRTPPHVLDPAHRRPAIAARVVGLGADVVCLQEVEPPVLEIVGAALPRHARHRLPKPGKPDGVATLTRVPCVERRALHYADDTGRVALFVVIELEGKRLGVANTHLKLDPSIGVAQAVELVAAIRGFEPACDGWIVCGDLNATAGSAVLAPLLAAELVDAHAALDQPTSNFAAGLQRIDFVLASPSLEVTAVPVAVIGADTVLPSDVEPSDHLPVQALARFR